MVRGWGWGISGGMGVNTWTQFVITLNFALIITSLSPPPIHHEFVFGVVMVDQSRERTKLCEGLFLRPEG